MSNQTVLQFDPLHRTTTLSRAARTSPVDQNPPHNLCRHCQKVCPALPVLVQMSDQPDVCETARGAARMRNSAGEVAHLRFIIFGSVQQICKCNKIEKLG